MSSQPAKCCKYRHEANEKFAGFVCECPCHDAPTQNYVDARTPEERLQDSKITSVMIYSKEPKDASLKNFIIGGGLRAAEELGQKLAQINKCKHGADAKRCWRKDCDEYIGDPPILESEIETLSAEVHQLYCAQYLKDHGKKYWTDGDYSKLEERVKEYDRNIVRWHLTHRHPRLGISHCMNLGDCPCHSLPTLEGDWETVFAEFCSKDPTAGSSGWYVGPNQVKTFITNLLSSYRQSQPIEHCSEPQCPECDKAAYQRGRTDERHSLVGDNQLLHKKLTAHAHFVADVLDGEKPERAWKELTKKLDLLSHLDK